MHDENCLICLETVVIVEPTHRSGPGNDHLHEHLHELRRLIHQLLIKEDKELSVGQEILDEIGQIDADVDAGNTSIGKVRTDIANLTAKINAGGMTAEETAATKTRLDELLAKAEAQKESLQALDDVTPDETTTEPPVDTTPPTEETHTEETQVENSSF